MSAEESGQGWILHSGNRKFGPLTEDELRGYFRAGMVKSVDRISSPGEAEPHAAADVAAALGETPPAGPPPPLVVASAAPVPAAANRFSAEAEADREARAARALAAANIDFAALAASSSPLASRRASWMAPTLVVCALVLLMLFALSTLHRMKPGSGEAPQQVFAEPPSPTPVKSDASADAGRSALVPGEIPAAAPAGAATAPAPAVDFQASFEKARTLLQSSDWSGLVAHATEWSAAQPERNEPLQFLGIGHEHLGNFDLAADALNRILARDAGDSNARILLADVYLQGQKWQAAADQYKELVRTAPNDARLWNNYGIALKGIDQTPQAVAALETAVRIDPGFKQAWSNLGGAYQALGDPSRAAAAFANSKP